MHSPKGVLLSAMVESFVFHKPGPANVVSQFKGTAGFAQGGLGGASVRSFDHFDRGSGDSFMRDPFQTSLFDEALNGRKEAEPKVLVYSRVLVQLIRSAGAKPRGGWGGLAPRAGSPCGPPRAGRAHNRSFFSYTQKPRL